MRRALLLLPLLLAACGSPDRVGGGSSSTGNSLAARVAGPDGAPRPGDTVSLRPDRPFVATESVQVALSDAEGRVRFASVPDGPWVLESRGARHGAILRLSLDGSGESSVRLEAGAYAVLEGRVLLPDGVPSARVGLDGTGQEVSTDSAGRFRFASASPGVHNVSARPRLDGSLGEAVWSAVPLAPGADTAVGERSPSRPVPDGWTVVWSDDFDSLDRAAWQVDTGDGCPALCRWGNGSLQRFVPEGVTTTGGELILRASDTGAGWTSGRIQSRGLREFAYGRFEVRAKLSSARGAWSLITLQGDTTGDGAVWPASGAIDVAGLWGHRADSLMGIAHSVGADSVALHRGTMAADPAGWADRWVTYAIEWTPTEIVWLADDRVYQRLPAGPPFDHPYYVVLQLGVGGDGNVAPDSLQAPFQIAVDRVRLVRGGP